MGVRIANRDDRLEILKWFGDFKWLGMRNELLPSTTYIVSDGEVNVASTYFYKAEGVGIAQMGITISNKDYDGDKEKYIKELLDFAEQDMIEKGCLMCFHYTDAASESFLDRYMKPRGFRYNKGFTGAKPLIKDFNIDHII